MQVHAKKGPLATRS